MSELTRRALIGSAVASVAAVGEAAPAAVARGQSQSGPMDRILLKDYRPETSLKVAQTRITKARFPVIDVHSHAYARTQAEVANSVRTMGPRRRRTHDRYDRRHRIAVRRARRSVSHIAPYPLSAVLRHRYDESARLDYVERAAAELVRCYKRGARGVGEITDKGSGLTSGELQPRAQRLHVDDPRLDQFWRTCTELAVPVNVHIADHPSCWRPPDETQERSPRFQQYNQYGRDVASYEELLQKHDRLLERHPKTTFIFCHLSNQGNDLASLATILDRFPNLHIDLAARDYEIGRQPRTAAQFLGKYRQRVLFGTDQGLAQPMYEAWWRLYESADEFIPGSNWWRHYGLALPNDVLRALYQDNAKRLLA